MYSIAIADDHDLFRRGIKDLLVNTGSFRGVIEAKDGKELISKISKTAKLPDACILDVSMPRMNGYETMSILAKRWPKLKVLVLSMYDDEQCIINMLRRGARGYALKDDSPEEIEHAILTIINDGYYHSGISSVLLSSLIHKEDCSDLELSHKEISFLSFVCSDLSYLEIAEKMELSPRTVDGYREKLFKKLKVKKRTALAMIAMRMGLV